MRLHDDALRHVLSYVGPKNYIFIATVCKQWQRQYRLVHGPETITGFRAVGCSLSTVLLYLREMGDSEAIVEYGDLQMTQWLCARNRLVVSPSLAKGAARRGHLHILKWLIANGVSFSDDIWRYSVCSSAATGGQLEVLKWARAIGCRWDKRTCQYAAKGGHLEVLKWARANGCSWDEGTSRMAALMGHLEVLKWARANECPWCRTTCLQEAQRWGHDDTVRWILTQEQTPCCNRSRLLSRNRRRQRTVRP